MKIKIIGKRSLHNYQSLYRMDFPRSGRKVAVQAHSPLLERVTTAAETKGIPCVLTWLADGQEKWRCHC